MRTIVIASQKGGVGKTTTAVNVAVGLAKANHKTLLIDMDPQANSTFALLGPTTPQETTYSLLLDEELPLKQAVVGTRVPNLDLIPSEINLAGAEAELLPAVDGRTRLKDRLEEANPLPYQYVIIDTPPSLGVLTINSLAAGEEVFVPVSASVFALKGIAQLEGTITKVRKAFKLPRLDITGVLCTLYDHTNVAKETLELLKDHFGDRVFETLIPKNVKLEEAHSRAQSVFEYAPNSKGADAYRRLVKEVTGRG